MKRRTVTADSEHTGLVYLSGSRDNCRGKRGFLFSNCNEPDRGTFPTLNGASQNVLRENSWSALGPFFSAIVCRSEERANLIATAVGIRSEALRIQVLDSFRANLMLLLVKRVGGCGSWRMPQPGLNDCRSLGILMRIRTRAAWHRTSDIRVF